MSSRDEGASASSLLLTALRRIRAHEVPIRWSASFLSKNFLAPHFFYLIQFSRSKQPFHKNGAQRYRNRIFPLRTPDDS